MGNGFKNYHRCQKNYQANKCDGISLFRYKEIDFLNHEVENFLSKDKHIVPIDLGVGINPLQGGLKTDLVFTIHRER